MLGGSPTSWSELMLFLSIEEELNDEWQGRLTVRVFRFGQWLMTKRGVLFCFRGRCGG